MRKDKFMEFKQKVVEKEKINQVWENRVEREMEKILAHPTPDTTYRVLTPPPGQPKRGRMFKSLWGEGEAKV